MDGDKNSSFSYIPRTFDFDSYLSEVYEKKLETKQLRHNSGILGSDSGSGKQITDLDLVKSVKIGSQEGICLDSEVEKEKVSREQPELIKDCNIREDSSKELYSQRLKSIIVDNRKPRKKDRKKERKSKKSKADREALCRTEVQLETKIESQVAPLNQLEEAEQELLFATATESGNGLENINVDCKEVDFSVVSNSNKEPMKRLTKFWQTPSPKKAHTDRLEDFSESVPEVIPIHVFQNFLNQNEDMQTESEIGLLKKEDNEYIERLSEELCRVFDFENKAEDIQAQKEELLRKVLKLGGENYTFSDLKKDLQSFEREADPNSQSEIAQIVEEPTDKDLAFSDQLLSEIGNEDDGKDPHKVDSSRISTVQCASENLDQLGISMHWEGNKVPNCGKTSVKRGRKSLKELREADGKAREQLKISYLFNKGKGKSLPMEQ